MNDGKEKRSARIWAVLPGVAVLLALGLVVVLGLQIAGKGRQLAATKQEAVRPEPRPVNVVTQIIEPCLMVERLELPAMVRPWEELTVKAEVAGLIVRVEVREGDRVEKGMVLAEIDRRDYENHLRSVAARQELARANFKRLQTLDNKGAVTQAALDEGAARLAELDAALAMAELNLERCTIRAPMAGTVNNLPAKVGMLASSGDAVAEILAVDRLKVEVSIPEADVAAAAGIKECRLTIAALDDREVMGERIFLSDQPAYPAMVYTMRLAVANPEGDIRPGMFARAEVIKARYPAAVGIPLFAVIAEGGEQFVYLIRDGRAMKQPVVIGFMEGWKVRVDQGLQPGDQVVIVGHRNLEDGQPVNVVRSVTDAEEIER